jgi:hypothetical protein
MCEPSMKVVVALSAVAVAVLGVVGQLVYEAESTQLESCIKLTAQSQLAEAMLCATESMFFVVFTGVGGLIFAVFWVFHTRASDSDGQ